MNLTVMTMGTTTATDATVKACPPPRAPPVYTSGARSLSVAFGSPEAHILLVMMGTTLLLLCLSLYLSPAVSVSVLCIQIFSFMAGKPKLVLPGAYLWLVY